MNDEEILTTVLHDTYTIFDFSRRMRYVRAYLESEYFIPSSSLSTYDIKTLDAFLEKKDADSFDRTILLSWGKHWYGSFQRKTMYDQLTALSDAVHALPKITVYLSFDLSSPDVTKLGEWMRKNISGRVLVDIHKNPSVVGGCALGWNGRYYDYSLSYRLSRHMTDIFSVFDAYEHRS